MNALTIILLAVVAVLLLRPKPTTHIQYLQAQLKAHGGQDRWDMPCTHCGKPMRGVSSITKSTTSRLSGGGSKEVLHGVFHADRPACMAASEDAGQEGDR
ncbi:hypothetical protein ACFQ6Q_00080 [Streptomyces sp. NPDC056437]|uniref:hypothetical protein n=1 Tax=Streptomyces sp. NPDC056437 TaxID=3345816 RepID=UPI0036752C1A